MPRRQAAGDRPAGRRLPGAPAWLVPAAMLVLASLAVALDPALFTILRHFGFDQLQRWSAAEPADSPVLIVDIDEESLRRLGQWPWPRNRMAELVERLDRGKPAAIGLDIVMAEADRTSPALLVASLGGTVLPNAAPVTGWPDHDEALAAVMAGAPVAIGFALTDRGPSEATPLRTPARFLTIGDDPRAFLPGFGSAVAPLPVLQAAARGQGALTFMPDADGVVRRVPLVFDHAGRLVPSLVTELLRLAEQTDNVTIRSAGGGAGPSRLTIGRHDVETAADASIWVRFDRRAAPRYLPAWTVLEDGWDADRVRGRVVLVGTSAQGLLDLRFSPLGGTVPGVEIHARALEQILLGRPLGRPAWTTGLEFAAAALGGVLVGTAAMLLSALLATAACAALLLAFFAGAWQAWSVHALLIDPVVPGLAVLAVFVPTTVCRYLASERQQRWVRTAFSRYVSPNLVRHLIEHPGALRLGGHRQRCSFVFADLAGFTATMEAMDPADAVALLNVYLDRMVKIAFEHDGTLDRIVGDSVAIVFSTPVPQADHEARALRCALAMSAFANRYAAELAARGIRFGRTRIGVHTGEVIVGNFGGSTMFDYRALGDPVNTASRLEGANKHLGTDVCVSAETLRGCSGAIVRPIGRLRLAGKSSLVAACEPVQREDAEYARAYAAMAAGDPGAAADFGRLAAARPGDRLVAFHTRRLAAGARVDEVVLEGK